VVYYLDLAYFTFHALNFSHFIGVSILVTFYRILSSTKSPMPRLRINSEDLNERDNGPPCINVDNTTTTTINTQTTSQPIQTININNNNNDNNYTNVNKNTNPFATPRHVPNADAIAALIAHSDPNDVSVL
jgi:hypothetical protein